MENNMNNDDSGNTKKTKNIKKNPYDNRRVVEFAQFRPERIETWLGCPECWAQELRINPQLEVICPNCNTILAKLQSHDIYDDTVVSFKKGVAQTAPCDTYKLKVTRKEMEVLTFVVDKAFNGSLGLEDDDLQTLGTLLSKDGGIDDVMLDIITHAITGK